MRKYGLLLALLAAPACLAEEQRWYVVNKDGGCEALAEGHDALPSLKGNWTPEDLLKVMREQYPDARLTPLADANAKDNARDTKKPGKKDAAAKDAPKDDALPKYFTRANAMLLTASEGNVEIRVYNWGLCGKLGALPAGPDQWLSALEPPQVQADETEVARASWFEVNEESIKDAASTLKAKSYSGITASWAVYIADRRYMPEPGKHTYLVRAIRTDRAGSHRLVFRDGVLYVIYLSAAPEDNLRYAPLVVNLPDAPDSVVVLHQAAEK